MRLWSSLSDCALNHWGTNQEQAAKLRDRVDRVCRLDHSPAGRLRRAPTSPTARRIQRPARSTGRLCTSTPPHLGQPGRDLPGARFRRQPRGRGLHCAHGLLGQLRLPRRELGRATADRPGTPRQLLKKLSSTVSRSNGDGVSQFSRARRRQSEFRCRGRRAGPATLVGPPRRVADGESVQPAA